jgi:hypothetical protein
MKMLYLLHADFTGTDSIQDVIENGELTYIPVPNVTTFEEVTAALLKKVQPGDSVILDTISTMGATVRTDIKIGVMPDKTLYEMRQKWLGDSDNWGTYTAAANIILRPLMNLSNRGAKIVTTVHEEERQDMFDMRTKRNVGLNEEFRKMLNTCTSDTFRITETPEDVRGPEGDIILAKGTRTIQIARSIEVFAKIQVPVPHHEALRAAGIERITVPTDGSGWAKMCRIIGKEPQWLTLYGLPGVGKTNFVARRTPEPTQQAKQEMEKVTHGEN